jgi:hypothetical protein
MSPLSLSLYICDYVRLFPNNQEFYVSVKNPKKQMHNSCQRRPLAGLAEPGCGADYSPGRQSSGKYQQLCYNASHGFILSPGMVAASPTKIRSWAWWTAGLGPGIAHRPGNLFTLRRRGAQGLASGNPKWTLVPALRRQRIKNHVTGKI